MAKTIGQLTSATTIGNSDLFVIEQSSQTKKVAASVVRGGLINADIDAAAAIAFSKLAALDDANILVGNGSNVATKVAVTGDVTISNAGVTAIGNNKVVTAMITDANVTPAKLSQPFTLATSQASTSGTSIDFTGIPSWAKRITVMFNGVSTNGSSNLIMRLGSGSFASSNYYGYAMACEGVTTGTSSDSSGILLDSGAAAAFSRFGQVVLTFIGSNVWAHSGVFGVAGSSADRVHFCAGTSGSALSGALDRVRITTVNGTDTFDAGTINISYEG